VPLRLCRGVAKPDSEARFCLNQKGTAGEACARVEVRVTKVRNLSRHVVFVGNIVRAGRSVAAGRHVSVNGSAAAAIARAEAGVLGVQPGWAG
jgi:hypothetical protein